MSDITKQLVKIKTNLPTNVTLVAVSKTKPKSAILEAYQAGQRIFGENKPQELTDKHQNLPKDIEWHMIGHLQTNKVKYIAPFICLIHGVDSFKLLKEIDKRAAQNERIIDCLIQVHIAKESSKFGFSLTETEDLFHANEFENYKNIRIVGLMGMATNTDNEHQIKEEFETLYQLYKKLSTSKFQLSTLSMGMSGDYRIAIECGSTMVRVGSSIFGKRNY